jgi:ADP-ribosylglycohydrolase
LKGPCICYQTLNFFIPDLALPYFASPYQAVLDDYVAFMTTPDTHNDTYCGTCHRMFFLNMENGNALSECPDNDAHNVDALDSLITPTVAALTSASDEQAVRDAQAMVRLTRLSPLSERYVEVWTSMIRSVARGTSVRDAVAAAGKQTGVDAKRDVERAGKKSDDPMTACYLKSNWPATLFMAHKYASDADATPEAAANAFRDGILANANRGGENVSAGAILGALWGAQLGFKGLPKDLVDGLAKTQRPQLDDDVDAFVNAVPFVNGETISPGGCQPESHL